VIVSGLLTRICCGRPDPPVSPVGLSSPALQTLVNNYSFGAALAFMLLDLFLYALLGWYLDGVLPASLREFGVPLPWYFPCSPRYWRDACSCSGGRDADAKHRLKDASALVAAAMAGATPMSDAQIARRRRFIEEPDAGLKAKVRGMGTSIAEVMGQAAICVRITSPRRLLQ